MGCRGEPVCLDNRGDTQVAVLMLEAPMQCNGFVPVTESTVDLFHHLEGPLANEADLILMDTQYVIYAPMLLVSV